MMMAVTKASSISEWFKELYIIFLVTDLKNFTINTIDISLNKFSVYIRKIWVFLAFIFIPGELIRMQKSTVLTVVLSQEYIGRCMLH